MANAISVKNLNKTFRGGLFEPSKHAVKSVSFDVPEKKVTGFVGANGSGKTTSLKCILQFIKPDSGSVSFFDNQVLSSNVKQKIGFFPERPYLYDFLTTKEFLSFHWQLSGGGAGFDQALTRVLAEVDLKNVESRRLRSFSKGMLQRIGIAQALLKKPELLILDEPMSGLDPDGRILIKDIIRRLAAQSTTIFFSSHLLLDLDELCQHLVVIDEGEVLYQGDIKEFKNQVSTSEINLEQAFRQLRQNRKNSK